MSDHTTTKTVVGGGIGSLITSVLGAGLGWIAYSKLAVDHNRFLPPALSAERRSFVGASTGRMSYYVDDSADGRPLVLVHSINAAASAYEVRPLFEHYRGSRPVYALELPGFGFSERSDRRYSTRLFVQAIAEFLAGEIGEAADVLALSLSSEFVARAAHDHPDLFASLILVSPSGFKAREDTGEGAQAASEHQADNTAYKVLSFPLWAQALYDLLATRPSIDYYLGKSFVGPVDAGLEDYAYDTSHQPGAAYAPLYFVSGSLFSPDIFSAVYEQLTLPVLVLYDQDAYTSFERLPELVDRAGNWHAERIVPTSGLPHFEQLDATVSAIDRHLAAQ